ncbi:MAG: Phage integrase family [Solirubrobacteraceae bacterium]|jgi:site-specific recombinase XerD|nr:Phage integrase family [Solirubrobacteraceae bacterium]
MIFTDHRTGTVWREESAGPKLLMPAMKEASVYQHGHLWHVLRHTYASVLAAGGVRRHELEQLMGHVTPGTTGIYTDLFRESYESVHSALDLVYAAERPGLRVVGAMPPPGQRRTRC